MAEAVRRHEDLEALARIEALGARERETPEVRFVEGRVLERLGRLSAAATVYEAIDPAALPAALREPTLTRRLRLRARSGGCAGVADELARRAEAPTASPIDLDLAGRCAMERRDFERAARWSSAALARSEAGVDRPALARALAAAYDALGRPDDATSVLREAYTAAPEHPKAEALRALLASRSPAAAALDPALRLQLVERMLAAREAPRALALLDEVPAPRARTARAAHLRLRGQVLFAMRTRYAEAAEVLAEAARLAGAQGGADALASARALSRSGDDPGAMARYDALSRRHEGTELAEQASYLAANLALRGSRGDGIARMQAFVEGHPAAASRERVVEGSYLLALALHGQGDHTRALRHLGRACRRPSERVSREACAYLGARIDLARGERDAAIRALRGLASEEPHAWYGLHARRSLEALGLEPEPLPASAPAYVPEPLTLPEEVAFSAALGLVEEAASALREHGRGARGDSLEQLASYVAAHLELEDPAEAFRLAREGARRSGATQPDRRAFFVGAMHPRPFAAWLEPAATERGVDPAYVYGTMRQESGFDASAVSRVGALGLLQLMPSTARRAASAAGIPFDPGTLLDPRVNVRVALAEMQALVQRYPGRLPLVAAAYNAGTEKVDGWIAERGRLPLDLFVEWIPFDETRGYVRRVIGHAARYHALAGRPRAGLEFVDNSPISGVDSGAP